MEMSTECAVARLEGAVGADGRVREADARRLHAGALEVKQRHVHPVRHAVEQRDGNALAAPGDAALDQRLQHGGVRHGAAGDVADGEADAPRPLGAAGDGGEAGLRLHQEVVGLHRGVFALLAVAGDVHGDQARMARAQLGAAEAGSAHGAGGKVLDEDIRLGEDTLQQRLVVGRLDVEAEALLAAVQPDEIGGQAVAGGVVLAREVALGALQLDDARPCVGEFGGAGGRGHRLFHRDDEQALERLSGGHSRSIRAVRMNSPQ
jgi:hypothetical protein